MITNFEEYTHDLTSDEKLALPIIIRGLNLQRGKNNAITNVEIRQILKEKYQIKISDPRIRKIINYIRVRSLVPKLCASSKGYYIAINKEEHYEYLLSLQERRDSINTVLDCGKLEFLENWNENFIS